METGVIKLGWGEARRLLGVIFLSLLVIFTCGAGLSAQAQSTPIIYGIYVNGTWTNCAPVGATVNLHGWNFTGVTQVRVDTVMVTPTELSDSSLSFIVPPLMTGPVCGKINLTSLNGMGVSADDLILGPAPANDNFAQATNLGSVANSFNQGTNVTATREVGETSGEKSVWWKWTSAEDGKLVVVDTMTSQFDTVLDVYTGTALANLVKIRHSDNAKAGGTSRVAFPAVKGTTYYIRLTGAPVPYPPHIFGAWWFNPVFQSTIGGTYSMALVSYGTPSTVSEHLIWARALMESDGESQFHNKAENLVAASSHVDAALALDSSNGEANFFKALIRIGLLQRQTEFSQLLTSLGVSETSGNVIHPHYSMGQDASGTLQFAANANSSQVLTYLQQVVVPTLDLADTNLGRIPTDFTTSFTDAEMVGDFALVDYADVQMLRVMIQGIKAASAFSEAYDLAFSLEQAAQLAKAKKSNIEYYKLTYANLLKFAKSEKRIQLSSAIHAASDRYNTAATWAAAHRSIPTATGQLFTVSESTRVTLNNLATSFDHEVVWDGNRINLSALLSTTTPLRDLLGGFKDNKLIANTLPDPTFAGCYPDGNLATVEDMMSRNKMLVQLSNYAAWAAAYLPGGNTQEQSPTANPTGDGLSNRMKYIFGLDPKVSHRTSEFMVTAPVKDTATNKTYLTLHFVRRVDVSTITYTVSVSDDLKTWDSTGTQVEQVGAPVRNDDGLTETVTVRIKTDLSLNARKFMRIEATDTDTSLPGSGNSGLPGNPGGGFNPLPETPPTTPT